VKRTASIEGRLVDPEQLAVAEREASVIEVEPGIYSVLWRGRSYEVKIASNGNPSIIDVDGHRIPIEITDPRSVRPNGAGRAGEGRQSIVAPMPGKIVRVLVAEGDEVAAGQGIVVVEAMKMQNEMKCSRGGRVVSVSAKEGAAVTAGEVLAVIE
jgi:biotin carboxyl carrier protein